MAPGQIQAANGPAFFRFQQTNAIAHGVAQPS
jgi:hypothetical protein